MPSSVSDENTAVAAHQFGIDGTGLVSTGNSVEWVTAVEERWEDVSAHGFFKWVAAGLFGICIVNLDIGS